MERKNYVVAMLLNLLEDPQISVSTYRRLQSIVDCMVDKTMFEYQFSGNEDKVEAYLTEDGMKYRRGGDPSFIHIQGDFDKPIAFLRKLLECLAISGCRNSIKLETNHLEMATIFVHFYEQNEIDENVVSLITLEQITIKHGWIVPVLKGSL